jgi:hypothetical protein
MAKKYRRGELVIALEELERCRIWMHQMLAGAMTGA